MEGQAQEPVTFEDVMVFLSRAEWDMLLAGQRELYRNVVLDTYDLLTSLGYPGPKPDILHRLERGEEPWICSSPGHARSWLEEPSSDWWPGASGYQGLETSCPGWDTSWCHQDGESLKKFGCDEGRSESPLKAGVGSQTQPWLVKEEAEHKPENLTQSETFLLHSTPQQQSLHPWEQLRADPEERNARNRGRAPGEAALLPATWRLSVEELRAAVAKDHSYFLRSQPAKRLAPRPCCLREHDYSWQHRAGRNRGAACRRLARQPSGRAGTIRRAREILRRYRPYRRSGFPWRGCSGCRGAKPGTNLEARGSRQLRSAGNAEGVTSDAKGVTSDCAPKGILATGASPLSPARERANAGAEQEVEGCVQAPKSQRASLRDLFRDVLKAVGRVLDSVCRKLELRGFSRGKSIWPIVIQIDNLEEMGKP